MGRAIRGLVAAAVLTICSTAHATEPAGPGAHRRNAHPDPAERNFVVKGGFTSLTRMVAENRELLKTRVILWEEAVAKGGVAVRGRKSIPVIMVKFVDTGDGPFPTTELQQQLFVSHPTGTLADFYKEISYGHLTVDGTVSPWYTVSKRASYFQGPIKVNSVGDPIACNGDCKGNYQQFSELLTEALRLANQTIDFSQYDNNGADGIPNSGDDDGEVDFVAFVHPGISGACGQPRGVINNNVWSHRGTLTYLTGGPFMTKDNARGGGKIRVDNYVIMPALSCLTERMIEIGVFAHEFGHAFGLPDLYDTGYPKRWQGTGTWDLMGAGMWGGDDRTPQRPTHMSAWSKELLGWLDPVSITADRPGTTLRPVELFPDALKIDTSPSLYYLIEYRAQVGFDNSLTGPGLLVWRIDQDKVKSGLQHNRVNDDINRPGVYLLQADGARNLDDLEHNRGDAGDPMPGTTVNTSIHSGTNPATFGNFSLCNVRIAADVATFDVRLSPRCP